VVIARLHEIQERLGYIPPRELAELARELGKPLHEVHGVASFYPHFRLKPPPRATLHVCGDVACHMKGAPRFRERLEGLAAATGGQVEVRHCSCLGQCDGAPAMLINDHPWARVGNEELLAACETAIEGKELPHHHLEGLKGPFKTNPYASEPERYSALRAVVQTGDYAGVLARLAAANLKGMGGAGFPTSRKWETVKGQASDQKYVICNGDEAEVGTFKDREILRNMPFLVIEAMTICALVTGATVGYIYIRHEYHEQIEIVREELRRARLLGIIGDNVLGTGKSFDLTVFVSPGGYVQGEETALICAIEGQRGQPRNKAVDVGFGKGLIVMNGGSGLFGKPTVVNNVETFSYIPLILTKGPEHFKGLGKNGCEGLKWIGVSGDVVRPGVFEVPMGTTYDEAINQLAGGPLPGRRIKGFAPSGPSFGLLPASMLNLKMDWGTRVKPVGAILGSGAVVAVDDTRCMLDLALNFTRFYRNESCGKCVPCRVGSQKLVDLILGLSQGTASDRELEAVPRLADTLVVTSICGLGQVVPSPILSLMEFFKDEIDAHTKGRKCPAGVCRTAGAAGVAGVTGGAAFGQVNGVAGRVS
jgi:formate dehydrogenase beta subunit